MFWRCCLGYTRSPGGELVPGTLSLEQCYFSQTYKKCNTTASLEQHWACKPWSWVGARLGQGHRGWAKNQFGTFWPHSWLKTCFGQSGRVCRTQNWKHCWIRTECFHAICFYTCNSPTQKSWMTKHQHLGTAHGDVWLWVSANYQLGTTVSVWCFIISLQMDILKR